MAIPEFNGIIGGTGYTCPICHAPLTGDHDAFMLHQKQCRGPLTPAAETGDAQKLASAIVEIDS